MVTREERTFLVESYVPHLDEAVCAEISVHVRAAIAELGREGVSLRWLRSYALVDEETHFCVVAAADRDHAVLAHRRAGFQYDNVVEVFAIEPLSPRGGGASATPR